MAAYSYNNGISPVIGSAKGGGVRKYSPRDDERYRERYQPDKKEKKDGEKQGQPKDSFSKLLAEKTKTPEKTEGAGYMTALVFKPDFTPQLSSSYIRAKILSSTLALEMTNLKIAE